MISQAKKFFLAELTFPNLAMWSMSLLATIGFSIIGSRFDEERTVGGPSKQHLEEIYKSINFLDDGSESGASFSNRGGVLTLKRSFRSDDSVNVVKNYYIRKMKLDGWVQVKSEQSFIWSSYKYCRRGISLKISISGGDQSAVVGVFLQWTKNVDDGAYCVR